MTTSDDEADPRIAEAYVASVHCASCGMRQRVPDGQDPDAVAREFRKRHRCAPRVKAVPFLTSERATGGNGATALSH